VFNLSKIGDKRAGYAGSPKILYHRGKEIE
jgi:hypothetical protein